MSNCQYMDLIANSNFRVFFFNTIDSIAGSNNNTFKNISSNRANRSLHFYPRRPFETISHLDEDQIVIDDRSGPRATAMKNADCVSPGRYSAVPRPYFIFTFFFRCSPSGEEQRPSSLLPAYYPPAKIPSVGQEGKHYRRLRNFPRHRAQAVVGTG